MSKPTAPEGATPVTIDRNGAAVCHLDGRRLVAHRRGDHRNGGWGHWRHEPRDG
jgi:hypothetical protein